MEPNSLENSNLPDKAKDGVLPLVEKPCNQSHKSLAELNLQDVVNEDTTISNSQEHGDEQDLNGSKVSANLDVAEVEKQNDDLSADSEDLQNFLLKQTEVGEDAVLNGVDSDTLEATKQAARNGSEVIGDETDNLNVVFRFPGSVDENEVFSLKTSNKEPLYLHSKRLSSSIVDIDQLARCQHTAEDVAEVKSFSIALLELAFEKQTDISSNAVATIQQLGRKHPSTVLRTLQTYLSASESQTSTRVLSTILTIMDTTINPAIEAGHLDHSLATALVKLALNEMIKNPEPIPDIQLPASNVLVTVGTVYCKDVIELLCSRLQNGIPHSSILVSLASLATLNIYGTVLHLKNVLNMVVALLSTGQIKNSLLRCSFATALAKFSEALLFYLANMERAPDVSVQRDWFYEDISAAFEILFLQWLPCKATTTCQEILEALGQMSQLLSEERLEHMAPKLLPSLIQSYRGPVEPLYVSRCLALFLDAFFYNGSELPDATVHELLQALFQQMTIQPDYSQPSTVKNNYEVLRCLERLARVHLEKVVGFLLSKVEQGAEQVRVAALTVLKHLINSLKEQLEPHVAAIGAQLKLLCTSDANSLSNNVKKVLVQVIVAMAVQGHLLASDTIHSGRHIQLIAFLLKLCTLVPGSEVVPNSPSSGLDVFLHPLNKASSFRGSISSIPANVVSNDELRQMCENVIHLLVTTQSQMEDLFWPVLLRYALDPEHNRAFGVIARALAHLVTKKRQEPGGTIIIDEPTSTAIVARFFVLARSPVPYEKCSAILTFLQHFSAIVHPTLAQLWQVELPQLASQLKGNVMNQPDNQNGWLLSLEKLADVTLARIKLAAPEWTRLFATDLLDQVGLYGQQPLERGFLLHLIGISVYHGIITQGPSYAMDFIMTSVRHQMIEESIGCASAMGWCARGHLDVALLRLQNLERNDYGRKSSGFLGFMKENRSEVESDMLKSTAARCYARIVADAPATELLLKVDKHVIRAIIHILQSTKDRLVRQEGLDAVASVAQALWPERLQERYVLAKRPDLLKETLVQLKSVSLADLSSQAGSPSELKRLVEISRFTVRALDALSALIRLPPVLGPDDQSTVLETGLERGIPLYAQLCQFAMEEWGMVDASLAANQLLIALENLTLQFLRSSLDPAMVDIIFSQLQPWARGQEGPMRRAALTLLKLTLATFFREVEFEPGAPTRFGQGHIMIAKIIPRCTDPESAVRDLAIDCLSLVLNIISKYLGYSGEYEKNSLEKLESLKTDLGSADPTAPLIELANLLNSKTPTSDVWAFLESAASGLNDPFATSSSGVSFVICLVLKVRGGEIHLRTKELLDMLLFRLKNVECPQTRRSILNGVCLLASHQRDVVTSALLSHSLPHNEDISDCWKALAADSTQATAVLDHLIDILTYAAPYEERGPHANEAIVSFRLLSTISALKSMCLVSQISSCLQARFPHVFCLLILAQSCMLGASPPIHFPSNGADQLSFVPVNREAYRLNPYQMCADTFKSVIVSVQLDPLMEPLTEHRHWTNSGDLNAFCALVASMTALCTVFTAAHLPYMIVSFSNALKSSHQRHRLAAVAFYAELIHQRAVGRDLDVVIRGLTSSLPDSSLLIRRIALKGLGSLGDCDPRQLEIQAPSVLNALMEGLEEDGREPHDGNCGTVKEALEGLLRLVPVVSVPEVERLASRLALRVRPFFEHELPQVRQAAISLLAQLFIAGSTSSASDRLAEQVHATLTSLLLHLNEGDPSVVRACKLALREAGPLLDRNIEEGTVSIGRVSSMFQTHLPEEGRLNYLTFLTDLVKLIAVDCEEWITSNYLPAATSYFKSPAPELRANAALFVGLLCGASRSTIIATQQRNVSLSLIRLLHDPVKSVRLQAMNAISLMFG